MQQREPPHGSETEKAPLQRSVLLLGHYTAELVSAVTACPIRNPPGENGHSFDLQMDLGSQYLSTFLQWKRGEVVAVIGNMHFPNLKSEKVQTKLKTLALATNPKAWGR